MGTFKTEMLTLHQPQPSIWNLFQGLPFRCVEFHVNVAAEKGINEPNLAALPSFNRRKAQTKKFLSTSTLTFPRVALGSFSPPDKGAAPGSPISELASQRGRTDLGAPRSELGHLICTWLCVLIQGPGGAWEWDVSVFCPKSSKSL